MLDDIYPPWREMMALYGKENPLDVVMWAPDTRPFLDPPDGWVPEEYGDSPETMKGW